MTNTSKHMEHSEEPMSTNTVDSLLFGFAVKVGVTREKVLVGSDNIDLAKQQLLQLLEDVAPEKKEPADVVEIEGHSVGFDYIADAHNACRTQFLDNIKVLFERSDETS